MVVLGDPTLLIALKRESANSLIYYEYEYIRLDGNRTVK